MGYSTFFNGCVRIDPPLNEAERSYLEAFARSRRVKRGDGPYALTDYHVIDNNCPPTGQPGLWCQWVPTPDGSYLAWDEGEKFYHAAEWMAYLIDHFLKPGAEASKSQLDYFTDFTFDHVVNGEIEAQGDDAEDRWVLVVKGNEVLTAEAQFTYNDPKPIQLTYPDIDEPEEAKVYRVQVARKVWQTGVAFVTAASPEDAQARASKLDEREFEWMEGDNDGPPEVEEIEEAHEVIW